MLPYCRGWHNVLASGVLVHLQKSLLSISFDLVWVMPHYDTYVILCNVVLDQMNIRGIPKVLGSMPILLIHVVITSSDNSRRVSKNRLVYMKSWIRSSDRVIDTSLDNSHRASKNRLVYMKSWIRSSDRVIDAFVIESIDDTENW